MFKMRVEGGAELAAQLNRLAGRVSRPLMRRALTAAGEPIRRGMQQMAPRRPPQPDLADHMVISPTRAQGLVDNDEAAAVAIGPDRDFFYGFFQEEGTAFHGAQPFARPAFESGVDQALASIVRSVWTELAALGISRSVNAPSPVNDSAFEDGGAGLGAGNFQTRGGRAL